MNDRRESSSELDAEGRVFRALKALEVYEENANTLADDMADILTDLMFLSASDDIDFTAALARACRYCIEETK